MRRDDVGADTALLVFDAGPEVVIDDAQLGHCVARPFLGWVQPRLSLPRLWVGDKVLAVPDAHPDVVILPRFSSGLFRAIFAMKEIKNGKEIHRRVSA